MIPICRLASLLVPLRMSAVAVGALALAGTADAPRSGGAASRASAPAASPAVDCTELFLLPTAPTPVDWESIPALACPDAALWAALACSPAAPGAAVAPPPHDTCAQVAFVARIAALEEARADHLFGLAKCLNAHGSFGRCLRDLQDDYREAVQLARDQYTARRAVCELLGEGAYRPDVNPRDFSHVVDNRYWPIVPGRTLVYRTVTAEGVEVTRVTALAETVEIAGVRCAIVRDVVSLDGDLIEDTHDWYAQHRNGDLWYMGEIARNYEDGLLADLDGSWRTGKDGALPGILMPASPRVGAAYRQEFLLNEAEDIAEVVARGVTVTVPAGTFRDCLQTEETTPLEPDVEEQKYYAPGIGFVLGVNADGERTELVEIIDP